MSGNAYFVPEAEQVHADWYKEWGKTIGSPQLAEEMFNNNRLRNRVHEQLIHTGNLQVDASFSPTEIACLNAYSSDKKKLERICGLVVYGEVLRENINKSDYDLVTKMVAVDEMKTAVGLRDYHLEDINFSVDMTRLDELVLRTGAACVALWKGILHPQMRVRVDLLDQPGIEEPAGTDLLSADQATAIVNVVAGTLWAEKPRLAA